MMPDPYVLPGTAILKNKFNLTPMDPSMWKHARMRPQNSPELRIRQFAQLLYQSESLLSKILDTNELKDLEKLFVFEENSVTPLGKSSIDILLIIIVTSCFIEFVRSFFYIYLARFFCIFEFLLKLLVLVVIKCA